MTLGQEKGLVKAAVMFLSFPWRNGKGPPVEACLFSLLIPVWQVRIINPQISQIYFRCVLLELQRFPQARGLTGFPQGTERGQQVSESASQRVSGLASQRVSKSASQRVLRARGRRGPEPGELKGEEEEKRRRRGEYWTEMIVVKYYYDCSKSDDLCPISLVSGC